MPRKYVLEFKLQDLKYKDLTDEFVPVANCGQANRLAINFSGQAGWQQCIWQQTAKPLVNCTCMAW